MNFPDLVRIVVRTIGCPIRISSPIRCERDIHPQRCNALSGVNISPRCNAARISAR